MAFFRPDFNRSIPIASQAEGLTSESGAIRLREAMERLGSVEWMAEWRSRCGCRLSSLAMGGTRGRCGHVGRRCAAPDRVRPSGHVAVGNAPARWERGAVERTPSYGLAFQATLSQPGGDARPGSESHSTGRGTPRGVGGLQVVRKFGRVKIRASVWTRAL